MNVGNRRALAALLLATACGGGSPVGPLATDPRGMFNQVAEDFGQVYPFFAHNGIDWPSLTAAYRDSVAAAPNDGERARLIGAMLGRLNDYHADLTTSFGVFGPPPIPFPHHFSPALVRRSYVIEPLRLTAGQQIAYAQLGSGIGYIHINSFAGAGWGGTIDDVLAALKLDSGLVLDIRDNTGGNEDIAREVAARFYDQSRVYRLSRARVSSAQNALGAPTSMSLAPGGRERFRGPIMLLTNRFNGSAAEDFLLMMRVLPHVVTIGDTTLGLGSHPVVRKLGNGWTYRLPETSQSTPDGFVYQSRGLPPALPIAWSVADTAAGRDPYIEAALARLRAR